jgi:hypothetical protein
MFATGFMTTAPGEDSAVNARTNKRLMELSPKSRVQPLVILSEAKDLCSGSKAIEASETTEILRFAQDDSRLFLQSFFTIPESRAAYYLNEITRPYELELLSRWK